MIACACILLPAMPCDCLPTTLNEAILDLHRSATFVLLPVTRKFPSRFPSTAVQPSWPCQTSRGVSNVDTLNFSTGLAILFGSLRHLSCRCSGGSFPKGVPIEMFCLQPLLSQDPLNSVTSLGWVSGVPDCMMNNGPGACPL